MDMQRSLADLTEARIADGKEPIRIGIGIHCGQAGVGSGRRGETVIGHELRAVKLPLATMNRSESGSCSWGAGPAQASGFPK
jgi:hypothetical protein